MSDEHDEPPKALSPAEQAEAELWAKASPHERAAAMMVAKATQQERMPHILAELMSVAPKDALAARLAALALALSHAAVENLSWARLAQPYPDGARDRALFAATRLAEASYKAVDALGRHQAGGATEHKVVVTHKGPAAELAVGVRVTPAGERGQEDGRQPEAPAALAHAVGAKVRGTNKGGYAVPVAGDQGAEEVPDARGPVRRT